MKINDDHLYHGAALTQIAEHPQFTAINSFKLTNGNSRSAFKINDEIGVYLKYATYPVGRYKEYAFTFRREHLEELKEIKARCKRVFCVLVCVKDRQICCLSYAGLRKMIKSRGEEKGSWEDQYVILVTLPKNKAFRVYVNVPGERNKLLGKPILIARNSFPAILFK
jgi:hypothetical protein